MKYWDARLTTNVDSVDWLGNQETINLVETEYVPIGTFVITNVEVTYPLITLTVNDRMWYCSNFTAPYTITAGTAVIDALTTLSNQEIPANVLSINLSDTSDTVPITQLSKPDSEQPTDALQSIAENRWPTVRADPYGTFVLADEPTTTSPLSWSTLLPRHLVEECSAPSVSAQVYNAVVYTSEFTTAPVRGYAEDDDPMLLTIVQRIGTHPFFPSSPSSSATQLTRSKTAR